MGFQFRDMFVVVISYWLLGFEWIDWDILAVLGGAVYLWRHGLLSDCLVFVDGFTDVCGILFWFECLLIANLFIGH